MELNHDHLLKLQQIFDEAWDRVESDPKTKRMSSVMWSEQMNGLGVTIIGKTELMESFQDMVNFGHSIKDSVCILNPVVGSEFLIVPHSLADKCLVLGGLP